MVTNHDMADQLYLSYWVNDFRAETMLRSFERMLRLFPFSRLSSRPALLRVYAIDMTLPPLLEHPLGTPPAIELLLEAVKKFENPDIAIELECDWDLWQWTSNEEWKLEASRAALLCFGPEFEHEVEFEQTGENLRIEFGIDANFLPQPGDPGNLRMAQSNIRSLLKLTHDLDDAFPGERRLWSESGENFAEKLRRVLEVSR